MQQVNFIPSPSWEIPVEVPGGWGVFFPTLEVESLPTPVKEYLLSLGYLVPTPPELVVSKKSNDLEESLDVSNQPTKQTTNQTTNQTTKQASKPVDLMELVKPVEEPNLPDEARETTSIEASPPVKGQKKGSPPPQQE